MSLCPSVGSELVNWLTNRNVSLKNLDKIAEHDLMQERGQALKGQQMTDDISFCLEFCSCLLLRGRGGGGGTGQIPVVVYQETTSLCHVEVLTPRGFHLAPSDAHRNTSTGSATLGNQWLYALPSCRYCSVDLWRDGEAKTD